LLCSRDLEVTLLNRDARIRVSISTSLSHRPGLVRHYYNDVTRRGFVTEMEEHDGWHSDSTLTAPT